MTDTLSYHKHRPLLCNLGLADVPVQVISAQWEPMQKFLKSKDGVLQTKPEQDALWFYMANHAMLEISQRVDDHEPLGEFLPFVEGYHSMVQLKALRMFYYLLMITTREARHHHNGSPLVHLWKKYPKVKAFHKATLGKNEMSAVSRLVNEPPNMSMGEYTDWLVEQFDKGSYGGGYGGKAWGTVAKCLREFVHGRTTAEVMMDTAFTLCHNNGPIFNKGMVFESYSGSSIQKILDVQRSGQIPQMVAEKASQHVSPDMRGYVDKLKALIPSFGGYVDWHLVESLGAMGNYGNEKDTQDLKHGKPEKAVYADKLEAMKAKAQLIKEKKEKELYLSTHFEVMPNVFVEKTTRIAS